MGNCCNGGGKFRHPEINGECSLCLDNFTKKNLYVFCNRSPCNSFICKNCILNIINEVKNKIFNKTKLLCPFCRRQSDSDFMNKFGFNNYQNFADCLLANPGSEKFGICRCGTVEVVTTHNNCDTENVTQQEFECSRCSFATNFQYQICARCGNGVEKNGGCNHMTCRCNYQWCWICHNQWGTTRCTHNRCNPLPIAREIPAANPLIEQRRNIQRQNGQRRIFPRGTDTICPICNCYLSNANMDRHCRRVHQYV
jgi:hypothetical protein